MEVNASHDANAKPPPLTSDQLNYLIWRYLQESGYAEAAVKLQRDWKIDAEALPFAKRISGQALISLVQKGLRYHHLNQTLDENGRASKTLVPEMFFFGPEAERELSPPPMRDFNARPNINITYSPSTPDLPAANNTARKHGRDSGLNGVADAITQSAIKRSRKTTNAVSADRNSNAPAQQQASMSATAADNSNAMDIDQINGHELLPMANGRGHAQQDAPLEAASADVNGVRMDTRMDVDVDPAAGGVSASLDVQDQEQIIEPAPVISTLANGENIGVQVVPAKIANLGPTTSILDTPAAHHVIHMSFRPSDSSVLTASGEEFCGSWKSASGASWTASSRPAYKNFVDASEDTLVTAFAWDSSGSFLAIATYEHLSGQIHLIDGRELSLVATLPASQRAITSLKWLPSSSCLVGVAAFDDPSSPQSTASSLLLWDLTDGQDLSAPSFLTVPEPILDIDCTSHAGRNTICAAGEGAVYQCRASPEFQIVSRWPTQGLIPVSWTFVKCADRYNDRGIVIAAAADAMTLWIPSHDILQRNIHNSPITGLEVRPQTPYGDSMNVHEFATSSMDGTIRIWRYHETLNSLIGVAKVNLGMLAPVMALSYSPDGFCVAGAGYDRVRIFSADANHQTLAMWEGAAIEWRGASLKDDDAMSTGAMSSANGDHMPNSDHCLSWDFYSKKLAFGLGSQVAVIDFQR